MYSELELSGRHNNIMSLWGSGPALVGYQPIKPITTETVSSTFCIYCILYNLLSP